MAFLGEVMIAWQMDMIPCTYRRCGFFFGHIGIIRSRKGEGLELYHITMGESHLYMSTSAFDDHHEWE